MCGRFVLKAPDKAVADHFDGLAAFCAQEGDPKNKNWKKDADMPVLKTPLNISRSCMNTEAAAALEAPIAGVDDQTRPAANFSRPRYNIAPTHPVWAFYQKAGGRFGLGIFEWNLIPEWRRERPQTPLFNARSETLLDKPSFRASALYRRCLVPFEGWYEWQKQGRRSQPYYISPHAGGIMAFAAIWSGWHGPDGSYVETVAILTGASEGPLAAYHPRRPLVLPKIAYEAYLFGTGTQKSGAAIAARGERLEASFFKADGPLAFLPETAFKAYAVGPAVSQRLDGPDCLTELADTSEQPSPHKERRAGLPNLQGDLFA